MYLTIILLASLFTILSIYLLKIKKQNEQIIIFIVTSVLLCCFYKMCDVIMPVKDEIEQESEESIDSEDEQNLKMEILYKDTPEPISCSIEPEETQTPDKIIPLDSYNKDDCTNDNSCLIQPDSQNLFPGYVKINKKRKHCSEHIKPLPLNNDFLNDEENLNNYGGINNNNLIIENNQIDELKTCEHCKKVLDLLNKPNTEKFEYKNPLDLTHDCNSFNIHNLNDAQNLCIHCSQFY
jgi:hypothetical protein